MRTAVLGLPRIGRDRELKFALEAYWAGRIDEAELLRVGARLRADGWQLARDSGIDVIPSGDFSFFDHVLDHALAFGAIPPRAWHPDGVGGLDAAFAPVRGTAGTRTLAATKWFDTNYHHVVPELRRGQEFALRAERWVTPLREARALGIRTRPVVLGPLTFLYCATGVDEPLKLLDDLVAVYVELLQTLAEEGACEAQIDEPWLVLDRTRVELDAFAAAWTALHDASSLELCLATYFAGLDCRRTRERALTLPAAEIHVDLVRAPAQLEPVLAMLRERATRLSLGVVDGRNVWRTDLDAALVHIDAATAMLGCDRVTIAPSCSLLHLPYEARRETALDGGLRSSLAFAVERLDEIALLRAAAADDADRDALLRESRKARAAPRCAASGRAAAIRARVAALTSADHERASDVPTRRAAQQARVALPPLPTTTIGSFPQTVALRAARRGVRDGLQDHDSYERLVEAQIAVAIAAQERLGLDVLVHGEPERDDMVEYFAGRLDGFAITAHGWVQSYGNGCVKPPLLHGDVSRPAPMTVRWWQYAQSLTARPVKAILTGPVTMAQWSFLRDDLPRSETCMQLALAVGDEVRELERAGAFAIQVDEPALREGLPLRRRERAFYLQWAVDCFRLAVAGVRDDTQIHTHICCSQVEDIVDAIVRLDADVVSIEASHPAGDVMDRFAGVDGPGSAAIGPGLFDTRAPRPPTEEEIERRLELAEARLGRDRVWVNPDCGFKSRTWDETFSALARMMAVAHRRRMRVRPP